MTNQERAKLEEEVSSLEQQISHNRKELNHLRRKLDRKEVNDYVFRTHDGGEVSISELFGDKNELIVVHNMGSGCRYCTLWADGFNGLFEHVQNRAPFVVISPDEVPVQKEFYESRNWKFPMVSSHGTTFFKDLDFESEDGKYYPGVSTFEKDDSGKIYRVAKSYFGPGDEFCSAWHFYELLPGGANGWQPQYQY